MGAGKGAGPREGHAGGVGWRICSRESHPRASGVPSSQRRLRGGRRRGDGRRREPGRGGGGRSSGRRRGRRRGCQRRGHKLITLVTLLHLITPQ